MKNYLQEIKTTGKFEKLRSLGDKDVNSKLGNIIEGFYQ